MTMCVAPIVPETTKLRLTVSKAIALRHLNSRLEQGVALRKRRVRYVEDLEDVRAEKAAWVQTYTDLLRQMFHGNAGSAIADACNDWVGRVYPEYAEVELFVEQFYEEMDYRIARLREVTRQVAAIVEMPAVPPAAMTATGNGAKADVLADKVTLVERTGAAPATPKPATDKRRKESSDVTTAADVNQSESLATALLVSNGERSPMADGVRRFLLELGIDVVAVRAAAAAGQDGKAAVAALEQGPAASFAVLLLNAEDVNGLRAPGGSSPAVTFQLGYLVGRLGLPRVCILCEGGTEVFHDPHGILCLPLDAANGWHLQLARQLKRAGVEVDLNKLC